MGSRQRPDLMRDVLRQLFPRLTETTFDITSPQDGRYNCVAWAAGDVKRWWWPAEPPFAYWPSGVAREESVASFTEAFASLGYEVTGSGDHGQGFEKVAIFAASDGVPTHVARQLTNGSWTSKVGSLEDISHADAGGVSGTDYGEVVAFMRRPIG